MVAQVSTFGPVVFQTPRELSLRFFESYGNPGAGRFTFSKQLKLTLELVTTLDAFAEERGWFESRRKSQSKVDVNGTRQPFWWSRKVESRYRSKNILRKRLEDPERRHIEAAALELLVTAGYKLRAGRMAGACKDSPGPI
jgi:hypothetical protein